MKKRKQVNCNGKALTTGTDIAVLWVDSDLYVKGFTPRINQIFDLDPSNDVQLLEDISHHLNYDSITDDITHVLDTLEELEKEVSTLDGTNYVMHVCPRRSPQEDHVQEVVITFQRIIQDKKNNQPTRQEFKASLAKIGTHALKENDLHTIIHRTLQEVEEALDIDYSLLATWHPETNTLQVFDYTGMSLENDNNIEIEADVRLDLGYVLKESSPAVVTDYSEEERFNVSPLLNHLNVWSGLVIRVSESEDVCGVLGLYSEKKREFSENELHFVQVITNIIGMVSERAKTKQTLEETNRRLEDEIKRCHKYKREILQNSINERWNIGGYLHDNLAQLLASIKIMIANIGTEIKYSNLDLSSEINLLLKNIDEGIAGIRNLTHDIIPVDIEEEGVEHAFRLLIRQLKKIHEVDCILEVGDIIDKIKNKEVATNLYHIIQEAVKNAVIHGKAENIKIKGIQDRGNIKLQITDDGIGLSNTNTDKGHGSGTNIMRYRIELLGGTFSREDISDENKTGTRITCTLPADRLDTKEGANGTK